MANPSCDYLCTFRERVWIPDARDELKVRLLIIAHCSFGGYRGSDTTAGILREHFICSTLDSDTKEFLQDFIH